MLGTQERPPHQGAETSRVAEEPTLGTHCFERAVPYCAPRRFKARRRTETALRRRYRISVPAALGISARFDTYFESSAAPARAIAAPRIIGTRVSENLQCRSRAAIPK
jgi:hypothetical protein